ncbi:hypothetical protein EV363DRAFT_1203613 [Boletus edulis]|uniref:Uncharacterized protein n=1 Tax=Boletus edulis BED1 TaxID=1328754 RepID=A0AAD4BMZ0_BOLED|nr:hypothetical protein EV363DRAFT_1203613 [Boletus edulis]KAF8421545.1 hypothetical protein L210DRAFT_885078 [Boletus edulis BED1]KAF8435089.1 hypothetical protein L210DRAFT_3453370 [Boletus edulis BED1]
MPTPYLPHILYSTALTSISIHLLWQRTIEREDRARYHAQVSILEDLAQQLRSGAPITDEEITRLKNLARVHGKGEEQEQRQSTEAIRWSEVVWGRKATDGDQKPKGA